MSIMSVELHLGLRFQAKDAFLPFSNFYFFSYLFFALSVGKTQKFWVRIKTFFSNSLNSNLCVFSL